MSGVDLTAKSYFGPLGAIVFPGVGGYSRNLWDTSWDNWGPRVGAAYQVSPSFVIRGGFGITYLPSNTGYFTSPTDYGTSMFSSGTLQQPYGPNPNGVPVGHFWDPAPLSSQQVRILRRPSTTELSKRSSIAISRMGKPRSGISSSRRHSPSNGSFPSATARPKAIT
jgi:hypothetical protein